MVRLFRGSLPLETSKGEQRRNKQKRTTREDLQVRDPEVRQQAKTKEGKGARKGEKEWRPEGKGKARRREMEKEKKGKEGTGNNRKEKKRRGRGKGQEGREWNGVRKEGGAEERTERERMYTMRWHARLGDILGGACVWENTFRTLLRPVCEFACFETR